MSATSPAHERILDRLEGVKPQGPGQWAALCPAHDDSHASLRVGTGNDERVLLTCRAGCDTEAIVDQLDLGLKDLFNDDDAPPVPWPRHSGTSNGAKPASPQPTPAPLPGVADLKRWRAAIDDPQLLERLLKLRGWTLPTLRRLGVGFDGDRLVFEGRDQDGELVTITRYMPGATPKSVAATGRPRVLFPPPESYPNDEVVYVVEGEGDAISGCELGLPAVGIPGTAYANRGKEWAERFRDRRVAILMDCDTAGRDATVKIRASLHGVAAEVRIVELDPGRVDGYDLTDRLLDSLGGQGVDAARAELVAAVEAAAVADVVEPTVPTPGEDVATRPKGRLLSLVRASEIKPENTAWVWEDWIPAGGPSLLVGKPGLGKTTLLTDLAAQLTKGRLPGKWYGEPQPVIFATAEDSLAQTLVPRLLAAGADTDLVHFVKVTNDGLDAMLTLPDDVEALAAEAARTGARLIGVDPLVAFLGGKVDAHKDQDVRTVLAPLANIAERQNLAVVGVIHFNKSTASDVLDRVSGSGGFVGAARSALAFGRDPSDPDGEDGSLRVLAHAKCNVGQEMGSLSYRVEAATVQADDETLHTSRLVYVGESTVGKNDLLATMDSEQRTTRQEAVAFLEQTLQEGPMRSTDLFKEAREVGISERTLHRAKSDLGIEPQKIGTFGGGHWEWSLPGPAKAATDVGHLSGAGRVSALETGPDSALQSGKTEADSEPEPLTLPVKNVGSLSENAAPPTNGIDDDWERVLASGPGNRRP
jgi:hypothetical protein